ncbi:protein of unknown function [Burkholderia multivorans]
MSALFLIDAVADIDRTFLRH